MPVKIDLTRFESTIQSYERRPLIKGKILLYGSSFFTNWGYERSQKQLSGIGGEEIATVNNGFGGSTGEEQLYFYSRMVRPYEPKMIVLRGCVNDIARGYTPDEAVEMTMRLYAYAKADFPSVRFAVLKPFDYRSASPEIVEGMKYYNSKIDEYLPQYPDLYVIDINPLLYEKPEYIGTYTNFRPLFVTDGLHFTDNAYENVFAPFFRSECERILAL